MQPSAHLSNRSQLCAPGTHAPRAGVIRPCGGGVDSRRVSTTGKSDVSGRPSHLRRWSFGIGTAGAALEQRGWLAEAGFVKPEEGS